jgi:hypothetical protein
MRPGAGKKRKGLIGGAVAALVLIAVGGYFLMDSRKTGSTLADDGPHKLITPETVLGTYAKEPSSGGSLRDDMKDAAKWGVTNPQRVGADYEPKDESDGDAVSRLMVGGAHGSIKNPEKTLDAFFSDMKSKAESDPASMQLIGSPEKFEPAGAKGAVVKCQQGRGSAGAGGEAGGMTEEFIITFCAWSDHSTFGMVIPVGTSLTADAVPLNQAAALTGKLRQDVRVRAERR